MAIQKQNLTALHENSDRNDVVDSKTPVKSSGHQDSYQV